MFNVCPECGQYSAEKAVICPGPRAVCPHCGHEHPFVQLPLFLLTGASGTGKSTIALDLARVLHGEAIVLEGDILWGPVFDTPDTGYRRFHEAWLRVAKNVQQCGLPVVLAGTFLPAQLESLPERRYFTDLHVLALVADEEDLVQRLRSRPAWRSSSEPSFIDAMIRLNVWFKANAGESMPVMELVNTSALDRQATVKRAATWCRSRLAATPSCQPFS